MKKIKKEYKVKITRSGYILILTTIVIAVAGVNTGNNLLYLIASVALSIMMISGFASFINIAFLEVSIKATEEVFARIPAAFTVTIKGPPWRVFFINLSSPFGETKIISFKKKAKVTMWLKLPHRGNVLVNQFVLHSGYPFGFFRRFRFLENKFELLVYPQPLKGKVKFIFEGEKEKGEDKIGGENESFDIKDFKNYTPGEPVSRIAWKLSARRGEIIVREFFKEGGKNLVIELPPGYTETDISYATNLILENMKMGIPVGLKLPNREFPPECSKKHRKKLLEALAHA